MKKETQSPKYIIENARKLRLNMTGAELLLLWEYLNVKQIDGYRFRRQHPVYRYILDFYCSEKKLAIEIDGEVHKMQREYDAYRDSFLQSCGITTMRFCNTCVIEKTHLVVKLIKAELSLL